MATVRIIAFEGGYKNEPRMVTDIVEFDLEAFKDEKAQWRAVYRRVEILREQYGATEILIYPDKEKA